jgi:hypothetical protein
MAKRHAQAARREPRHEIEPAVNFRRHGDDADIRRRVFDLAENVRAVKRLALSFVQWRWGPTPSAN